MNMKYKKTIFSLIFMGVLSASSLGYIHIKKGTFNLIGISNKQTQNDLFTTESFLDDKRILTTDTIFYLSTLLDPF